METGFLKKRKILQRVHGLSLKKGEKVYLVGGAIRDLLLGRSPGKDFDFVLKGDVSGLAKALAQEMGGHVFPLDETFGTWRVVIRKGKRKTEVDFSAMQGRDIVDNLRQRDFTMNSIAINLQEIFSSHTPQIIDPLDGLFDLRRRILRANSEESLRQDPLRMLRAFRLAATLGLKVEEETSLMIRRNKHLLLRSAWERIRAEFFLALSESRAGRFLRDLQQWGLLQEIFPEVEGWDTLDQGIPHAFPLLEHSLRTVEAGEVIFAHFNELHPSYSEQLNRHFSSAIEEGISRETLFKFVAFFHDSGKPQTKTVTGGGKVIRFLDHDQEGQRINAAIARRMKLSRKSIRLIADLSLQHMRILSLSKTVMVTPRAKYRFFRDLGKEGVDVILLAIADGLASVELDLSWPWVQELPAGLKRLKEVAEELLRYYFEGFSLKPPKLLLDGNEVMEALGLPQSKHVGNLLARLREAESTGRIRTKAEALEFLKNLDRSRSFG